MFQEVMAVAAAAEPGGGGHARPLHYGVIRAALAHDQHVLTVKPWC